MDVTKIIKIADQKFTLEVRRCGNNKCNNLFYTNKDSDQSICSIMCWQSCNPGHFKGLNLPKIYRPTRKEIAMIEVLKRRNQIKEVRSTGFQTTVQLAF